MAASGARGIEAAMITGSTRVLFLIGHPVAQVRTPPRMNDHLEAAAADTVMVPADIAPDAVGSFFATARAMANCAGVSVTVPHKQAAFAASDTLTDRARRIGAVNILCRDDAGPLHGDMTDGLAFVGALRRGGHAIEGRNVVLVGAAGGAGAAIADALCEAGIAALAMVDIDPARIEVAAASLRRSYPTVDILTRWPAGFSVDLAVNASPLGMRPTDPLPLDLDRLDPGCVVADVVTTPEITPLLAEARRRGHPIRTGIEMADAQLEFQLRHLQLWRN
jgi:shikimate dehydrogenase